MEHLLENLNRRLQDVLQRELESTTVAELTAAYIEGSA